MRSPYTGLVLGVSHELPLVRMWLSGPALGVADGPAEARRNRPARGSGPRVAPHPSRVLLLDEPAAGQDPEETDRFAALNAVAGRPKEEHGMEPQGLDEIRPGCYDVSVKSRSRQVVAPAEKLAVYREKAEAALAARGDRNERGWPVGGHPFTCPVRKFTPSGQPPRTRPHTPAACPHSAATR
ncbi:hypothetical protein [Streptomyces acidiscabies]|uniref:hypothetical protein n=1 Tax=Streptomyces acidiscabies TaxID=42234 RepID=UPI0038F7DB29